jgi:AraC family L-rhamnose operon regulatory protein RhaS
MGHQPLTYVTAQGVLHVDSNRPQRRAMAEGKIRLWALTHGHYTGYPLPPMALPGLSSIGHLDARGEQDWGLEPHRNEGIEISLLETGHMGFAVEGSEYRLSGGDVTITRPWQLHCLGNPHLGVGRFHWLILDVGVRRPHQRWTWPAWIMLGEAEKRELASILQRTEQRVWKSTPDLYHAFHEVAACVARYPAQRPLTRLKLHVNHLLLSLLEAIRDQRDAHAAAQPGGQQVVDAFLHQLHDSPDVATQPWTAARMAEHCGMGTTKFAELCHKLSNSSPWDYLIECRLQWAARQLRAAPKLSITQIALAAGFSTSQYFATCFRKRFHCTPREYRT